MTTDARHLKLTSTNGGVHTIVAYVYANETARLAATGFDADDVGKVALDQDTDELNWLSDDDPITWEAFGSGGSGESNTASNVGTAGVGVYKQKTGVDLELKKINAGSAKVTVTDDTGNDEIDIDVVTGTDANSVCVGNDSRLSDSRAPTSHASSHDAGGGDAMAIDAVAGTGSLRTLGTSATSACAGNDSRLSDSRTPTSHAASHQNGGGDEISVAGLSGLLADGQTPLSHATSHQSGGGDSIKLDDLASPDDNTDLNATTSAHGLLPKLGGGTTNYLRADGTWAAPAGGGGSGDDAKQFFADQLDTPVTSDWPVTTRAAGNKDSNNTGLAVRRFDDTTEEGVGFILEIPTGVTDIIIEFRSRAETSAASNLNVVPKLYYREIPDNAAVESWGNSTMTAITMGTSNEYFQYDSQTIALSTLSLVAGRVAQFELTRDAGAAGDTLVGDWSLLMVKVSFS